MREIKFSYIYQSAETGTLIDLRYTLDKIEKGNAARDKDNYLNQYSLVARRQYTGLKDTKGVEIYEGDVVRSKDGALCEVVFSRKAAKFCIQVYRMNPYKKMTKRVYSILSCEVVGNIYENPELLGESDELDKC